MIEKNICLVSPPSPFLIDEKVFPPLGLLYVASSLSHKLDGVLLVHDGPVKDIPTGYDIYGITATTPQFEDAKKALETIRSREKAKVIIGGPHASIDPQGCLDSGFDSVIIGEGEEAARIACKHNVSRIELDELGQNRFPARDLIDLHSYKYTLDGRKCTSVITARGCPFRCAFCCKTNGRTVRLAQWDFVVAELELIEQEYGFNAFMFFDDIFILDRERLLKILDAIKDRDYRWRCFVRGDLVVKNGQDVLSRMKDSGCVEVAIGIESGSDTILKNIDKGETTETIRQAIDMLKIAGIRVKGLFIVGLPGESWMSIKQTEAFVKGVDLDDVDFTIFVPYKGSPIFNNPEKYDIGWNGMGGKSWYKGKPGEYESMVWTSHMTRADIVKARDYLEGQFKRWE